MKIINAIKNKVSLYNQFLTQNKFYLIFWIIAVLFSYYFIGKINDGLNNIAVNYNNTQNVSSLDVANETNFVLPVNTSNLNTIHVPIECTAEKPILNLKINNIGDNEYTWYIETKDKLDNGNCFMVVDFFPSVDKENLLVNISSPDVSLFTNESGCVIYKQFGLPRKYIIVLTILFVLIYFVAITLIVKFRIFSLTKKYLVFSIILGLAYLFIRPPCSQYDDLIHYDTAYNMSNIMMGYGDASKTHNLPKRACDLNLLPNYYTETFYYHYHAWHGQYRQYYIHLAKNFSFSADKTVVDSLPDKVMTPQRSFVFSAIGITIGRLLGFNQFLLYYFGALINLAICVLLTYLGIKKNKNFNNHITACIALFPAVILLFASYSYDALLFSVSFAVVNYSISLYNEEKKSLKDIIILVVLSIFLLPIKGIYFPIVFFILLLFLFKKEETRKRNFLIVILVFIVAYIVCLIVSNLHLINFLDVQSRNYTYPDKLNHSLSYILQHPFYTVKVMINSIFNESYTNSLSDLFFYNPKVEYVTPIGKSLLIVLMVILALSVSPERVVTLSSFIISLVVTIFIFFIGISWTINGESEIWGIQARYFTPILPMYFYVLGELKPKRFTISTEHCMSFTVLLSFIYLVDMFFYLVF